MLKKAALRRKRYNFVGILCVFVLFVIFTAALALATFVEFKRRESVNLVPIDIPFCSDAWFAYLDGRLKISDSQGHGPDVGSTEWKSSVERKLGLAELSTQFSTMQNIDKQNTAKQIAKKDRVWCERIQIELERR